MRIESRQDLLLCNSQFRYLGLRIFRVGYEVYLEFKLDIHLLARSSSYQEGILQVTDQREILEFEMLISHTLNSREINERLFNVILDMIELIYVPIGSFQAHNEGPEILPQSSLKL